MKKGNEDKMEHRVLVALGNHHAQREHTAQEIGLPSSSDHLTQSLQSMLRDLVLKSTT